MTKFDLQPQIYHSIQLGKKICHLLQHALKAHDSLGRFLGIVVIFNGVVECSMNDIGKPFGTIVAPSMIDQSSNMP
jgi:hypothetical protein